ncbi:hypothetical protein EON65_46625 [archaeon]|nr:MAG: hypothetical protein EON65_46625 [archaeon]
MTTLIDSIYLAVHSLEDMQFLVQYAHLVLPKSHAGVTGDMVWENICTLQDELIQKRESAVLVLAKALAALYPEQKPEVVSAAVLYGCTYLYTKFFCF